IQVDSITKREQNDLLIPANAREAANFYQSNGLLRGRPEILAADATHTQIIGNFRFDYKAHPVSCPNYPWFGRLFMKSHIEIECDPNVWNQVESLIRSKLPSPTGTASAETSSPVLGFDAQRGQGVKNTSLSSVGYYALIRAEEISPTTQNQEGAENPHPSQSLPPVEASVLR